MIERPHIPRSERPKWNFVYKGGLYEPDISAVWPPLRYGPACVQMKGSSWKLKLTL